MAWTERYVTTTGAGLHDGTSEANAWDFDEAITGAAAGHRVNIQAGTYSLSSVKIISTVGTTTNPVWWRGYNATIGDLDTSYTHADFPYFEFTGPVSQLDCTGPFNWFSRLRMTCDASGSGAEGVIHIAAPDCRVFYCHLKGTSDDFDCCGLYLSSSSDRCIVYGNYVEAATTNPDAIYGSSNANPSMIIGNYVYGGRYGIYAGSASSWINNIIQNSGTAGVFIAGTTTPKSIVGNSIYNVPTGIVIETASTGVGISGNIFSTISGYAIDPADANNATTAIVSNLYHSCTSGHFRNIFESMEWGAVDATTSPFVDAAGGNFALSAAGRQLGFPQTFINLTGTTGYPHLGAVAPDFRAPFFIRGSNSLIGR